MANKIFAILFLSTFLDRGTAVTMEDYCKLSKTHTVCRTKCARSSACGTTEYGFKVLSNDERNIVLHEHNRLRNLLASGNYSSKGFKKATNMNVLSYDKELEFLAGCWIQQCIWEHDINVKTTEGEICSSNLAAIRGMNKLKMDHKWFSPRIVPWFAEEITLINVTMAPLVVTGEQDVEGAGHFITMCWWETKYVGCAKMYSYRPHERGPYRYDLFCNYKPQGYLANRPMYSTTPPACQSKSKYSSLCGEIRPMSKDKYKPPMDLNLATGITSFTSIFARLMTILLALVII